MKIDEFTVEELTFLSVARDDDVEFLVQCNVDIYKVFNLIHKLINKFTELEQVVIEFQSEE